MTARSRAGWVAAGVGAAAAATVWRRRGRAGRAGRARSREAVPSTTRAARLADMARLSAGMTRTYGSSVARGAFATPERREELRAERQLRTTADVVAALGTMKGALMKLGQMASYLDAGMPEQVREALASLQQDAPPMSAELAAGVIEAELGRSPEKVFAEWDPVPMAAASIGQVHRARTLAGVEVAVKVQYPGVDDAIRSDLDNTSVLLAASSLAFPGFDAGPVVAELRHRLLEELDYELEARSQSRFAAWYAGHPFIHIPAVLPTLSGRRVLTTELAAGARYTDVQHWADEERNLAAESIFRFVFGSLYRFHGFNGDPHPGNYLFRPGGRVSFLDFGLTKWFDPSEVKLLEDMVRTIAVERDHRAFRRAIERAGFLNVGAAVSDGDVVDYLDHYYDFVLRDGPHTITPEYASETVRRFFEASNPVVRHSNIPPAFVILQRINLGLYAVLGGLGATNNWRAIAREIWPFTSDPPSTPLGRAEAAWRATRPA